MSAFIAWWAAFVPRDDDIYIVSYPRSGTTLMQMLLYQITTDGSMDFVHISEVVPYLERAIIRGRDLNRLPSPRVFKTHFPADRLPTLPGRFIYLLRDGKDVLVSNFYFAKSHRRYTGTLAQFFNRFISAAGGMGSWFQHVNGWRQRALRSNVCMVAYEDLLTDFQNTLTRIASYCGIEIKADERERIRERCSYAFMKEREQKFDFASEVLLENGFTLGAFIREGKSGSGREQLSQEQAAFFDAVPAMSVNLGRKIEPTALTGRQAN